MTPRLADPLRRQVATRGSRRVGRPIARVRVVIAKLLTWGTITSARSVLAPMPSPSEEE